MISPEEREQRMEQYFAQVRERVREHGWVVQGVFGTGDDPDPNFAYTIGLTEAGLPELIISGDMQPWMMQDLLNTAAKIHLATEIQPGDTVEKIANVPLRAVASSAAVAPVQQALNYINDPTNLTGRLKVVQLLWPDPDDRFPGEPGYDPVRFRQQLWPPRDEEQTAQ